MPFTNKADRERTEKTLQLLNQLTPGDRCYVYYKQFMDQWNKEPRWTTMDKMASVLVPNNELRAQVLAFLVFFNLHGMEYETQKRKENGEVK